VWEELRIIAPWLALVAAVVMGAVVERMRRVFVDKHELQVETEHRKLADQHIEERLMGHAQTLHNYMGRLDLLRDQLNERDAKLREQLTNRDREYDREMSKLREEVRTGFAQILGKLDRNGYNHKRKDE
jgi:hypothetical protein